jgi:tetratricopeptide (TPR) repeat protein
MDTLYDLLGALPRDDAEGLRTAFRRAVKSTHPDLRPGDPDAALKFRQIVRANEILGDAEQRAAYDHLLALAHLEKDPAAAHPIAARIYRLASGVMALAGASIVTVGGYLLFMHMSMAFAPANNADATPRASANGAVVGLADLQGSADGGTSIARKLESTIPVEALVPRAIPVVRVESIPPLKFGAPLDPAPNYARFFHARGVSAYRNGDLNGAIADLDQAIQLDPKFSPSYIDRGIVFYRLQKLDRAFADIAQAKRIEKQGRPKPTPTIAAKPHPEQTAAAPPVVPPPQPRTTAQVWTSRDWVTGGAFQ